jgi:hypothetical protein
LNYFFGNETIKLKYGHKAPLFLQKYFWFSKMDKKNVQNRKAENTFPTIFSKFYIINSKKYLKKLNRKY